MELQQYIAERLRERGFDVSWNDSGQFRIVASVSPDKHINEGMTFLIMKGKIHCWGGEYDLFIDRPIDVFINIASKCPMLGDCYKCEIYKK